MTTFGYINQHKCARFRGGAVGGRGAWRGASPCAGRCAWRLILRGQVAQARHAQAALVARAQFVLQRCAETDRGAGARRGARHTASEAAAAARAAVRRSGGGCVHVRAARASMV